MHNIQPLEHLELGSNRKQMFKDKKTRYFSRPIKNSKQIFLLSIPRWIAWFARKRFAIDC